MGSKQGAETRRTNDILRFFDDTSFNLGIEDEQQDEDNIAKALEVRHTYIRPKIKSAFHKRLNKLLKDHNISKTQLGRDIAENTGRKKPIARQTIDSYASGKSSPTLDIVIYLCQRFGCSCDYLVGLEDRVTVEDEYISDELGLTQENIDYLRARTQVKSDTVIPAINLLLKDSCTYSKELKDAKTGKAPPVKNGFNVLFHLYRYLNIEKQNTLQSFVQEDWNRLSTDIGNLFDELDLDIQDQKISFYREKVQKLKSTYNDISTSGKSMQITETRLLTAYFQFLETSIKGLRKVLQQRAGQ